MITRRKVGVIVLALLAAVLVLSLTSYLYISSQQKETQRQLFGFSDEFELLMAAPAPEETKTYVVSGGKFAEPVVKAFHYKVIAPDTILFTYNAFEA